MMKTIKQFILSCAVCKHEWTTRGAAKPKFCPACHSKHWENGKLAKKVNAHD